MIFSPLIFLNRQEGEISRIENKKLALKPQLFGEDGKINNNYILEYEDYFNDNIGLREEALAANIIFKYKIFGVVDIPNWILGREGNLFYTSNGEDIKTYCGTNRYSNEQMEGMAECLYSMNQYFRQKGCFAYNMFIPNKECVYSDLYNPYVYHEEESRQDIFCEYLIDQTDLNVINIKNTFIDNKEQKLYYKSYDASHWNMDGAYIGYCELMQRIQKDVPDIKILSKEDFYIKKEEYVGLMRYYTDADIDIINNNFNFEDEIILYDLKSDSNPIVEKNRLQGKEIDPNLNFYHYYNAKSGNSEKLFIVGDSYIHTFLLPMLSESFQDIFFISNTEAKTIIDISEKIEPDIFVFETVERASNEDYFIYYMKGYKDYLDYDIYSASRRM